MSRIHRCLQLGVSLFCILNLDRLSAANGLDTWAGTTSLMSTPANWTGGSANRPPINGDSLLFPGSGVTDFSVTNDIGTLSLVGLTINSTSVPAYTISGGTFGFSNGNTIAFQDTQGGHTLSTPISLPSGGTLHITNAAPLNTISGGLGAGTGALTYAGGSSTDALILSGASSYSGQTTVSAGILRAGASNVFSSNSLMSVSSGATLDLNNFPQTVTGLTGGGGVSLGSGTLSLNSAGTNYTGVISGTGGLTVVNGGITFHAAQTYTGPTTVDSGGGIVIDAASNINSSSQVTLNGGLSCAVNPTISLQNLNGTDVNASITLDSTNNPPVTLTGTQTTIFNGAIQNLNVDQGIIKAGTGSLTLTNDQSTYMGGTQFNGGILSITVPDTVGSGPLGDPTLGAFTFNGGTLETATSYTTSKAITLAGPGTIQVDLSNTTTLSGAISGPGSLTKSGGGTLVLPNAVTYTGNTFITGGTLQVLQSNFFTTTQLNGLSALAILDMSNTTQNIDNLSGGGTVRIGAGQLSVNTGVFSGLITGTGTFQAVGAGTITFTNTASITLLGPSSVINIDDGVLTIDGTASAHSVTVSGGTLKGTGHITSTMDIPIAAGAILAPGDSPGVMNITGNITFAPLSILEIEVNPVAASELVATGIVDVTQAILFVNPDPGTYTTGTTYNIVASNTDIVSPFAGVVISDQSATRNFSVIYAPGDQLIQLQVSTVPFSTAVGSACSSNAAATAVAYETSNAADPDVQFITTFLTEATTTQLTCDFDQMNNALFNPIAITQETVTTAVRSLFTDRLQELHGPICASSARANRKGVWVAPFGNWESQDSRLRSDSCDPTRLGFHSSSYGVTLAGDGEWSSPLEECFLGGSLSYAHTELDWRHSQANSNAQTGLATFYATLFRGHFYLDTIFMGGIACFEAKRHIFLQNAIESLTRSAKHHNFAGEFDGHIEMGFFWNPRSVQLRPYAMFDYIYLRESGYREKGAQSLDLVVKARTSRLQREELGLSLALRQCAKSYVFSQELRFAYVHEERFRGKKTKARFVDSPDYFTVEGFTPDRNLFAPTFTLNAYWGPLFSTSATYAGEFGKQWNNQTANFKLLWKF